MYPIVSDPLFDPTFLPDPLDFTALKYVNKESYLTVDPILLFKPEIFTNDKQCMFTNCIAYEGTGCIAQHKSNFLTFYNGGGSSAIMMRIFTNTDDGYDKIFCAKCYIRSMVVTSSEFRIV